MKHSKRKIASMKKGKRCSDDLVAALFQFKDKNPNCSLRGISRIFGISYETVYGIFQGEVKEPEAKNTTSLVQTQLKIAGKCVKIIKSLQFNPQNTLKGLKLENLLNFLNPSIEMMYPFR